jgi:dethiobiotin synthetase
VRPERVVLVCGTGTDVGKTWVGSRLLSELRARDLRVAARKPAQSFDVDLAGTPLGGSTDAELLGLASGERADAVCQTPRWYSRAMAPPMAAEAMQLPPFTVAELVEELTWPQPRVDVGLVEMAGGVRTPQASDGDVVEFIRMVQPDTVILVAEAGLGTINGVRMSMDALATVDAASWGTGRKAPGRSGQDGVAVRTVVVLNRFDDRHDIHRRNRQWLATRDGFEIVALPGDEQALVDLVLG